MAGFAGMNKESRCAGGGQGGGNLVADMAGLAHAADHDAATAGQHELAGALEIRVDMGLQVIKRCLLDLDDALAGADEVEVGHRFLLEGGRAWLARGEAGGKPRIIHQPLFKNILPAAMSW